MHHKFVNLKIKECVTHSKLKGILIVLCFGVEVLCCLHFFMLDFHTYKASSHISENLST